MECHSPSKTTSTSRGCRRPPVARRSRTSPNEALRSWRAIVCMSIFEFDCEDVRQIAGFAAGYDPADPYSRSKTYGYDWREPKWPARFTYGVPRDADLSPFVDGATRRGFDSARAHLEALGGRAREIDMGRFFEASG